MFRRPRPQPPRDGHAAGGRTPWRWALAGGLAGALAALVLQAPARWLAIGLGAASQGRLLLEDARGTVWNGSARWVLTGGAGSRDRATLPGRVHWTLRPAASGLTLQLDAACCTRTPLRLQLGPRWGGARLDVADIPRDSQSWPAGLLSGLGAPWNTLQPDGQLALETRGFGLAWTAGRLVVTGTAGVTAHDLSSRLSTLRPLGSYRLTLQGGPAPRLELATLEGALALDGRGQWVGARLRFTGEARATPEREAALSNLLNIIGRRSGARSLITVG